MKIDIHFKAEELATTSITLQSVYNSKALTRKERSTLSIAVDVAVKFESKVCKAKPTLFSGKKSFKISLKHHEADLLEILLIQQMAKIEDPAIRRLTQQVIDKLNQKLV